MDVWGNSGNSQLNQNIVSDPANKNILKVNDVNNGNDAKIALYAKNGSNNADARALKVEGKSEFVGAATITGDATVAGIIHISGAETSLESTDGDELWVGTSADTGQVVLGRSGQTVRVNGGVVAVADIVVGEGGDGKIDANGGNLLKLGTQAGTNDVQLGRSGKLVKAMTDLTVGVAAVIGKVDSNGTDASPQDLQIGSGLGTANLLLSRSGETIDMFAQARMNSKAIIMNSVASITAANGAGFVYNSAGHGPNGRSVDFVINNVVVAYFDSAGMH